MGRPRLFLPLLLVLGLALLPRAAGAEPVARWESRPAERSGVLRIEFRDGEPIDEGGWQFNLALPPTGGARLVAVSLDGRPLDPTDRVWLGPPFAFRKGRALPLIVLPRIVEALAAAEAPGTSFAATEHRLTLRLQFDLPFAPDARQGSSPAEDPLLAGLLVNPQQWSPRAASSASGARDEDEIFDGTGRWIRLDITQGGLYELNYDDLRFQGVEPGTSMGGFRLLGSGGQVQPFRMGWPGGSWDRGWQLEEIPLQVIGGEGLGAETRLRFYLPGVDGFLSDIEPGAPAEDYYRNPYAPWATYYLTWGGADGQRADSSVAAPDQGDPILSTGSARLHREKNIHYSNEFLHEDGWSWHSFDPTNDPELFVEQFPLLWPAADRPFRLRIGFDAQVPGNPPSHHLLGYIGALDEEHKLIDERFEISRPIQQAELEGEGILPAALEGAPLSTFILSLPADLPNNFKEHGHLLWYQLFYETRLRTRDSAPLDIQIPADQASAELHVSGWQHQPVVWDVTELRAPRRLVGGSFAGDSLRLRLETPTTRHLIFVDPESAAGFLRPDRITTVAPRPLRNSATLPHMVVIYFDGFRQPAQRYASYRSQHFPMLGQGEVEIVAAGDIYANFNSGMAGPVALRNYLKYRYETPGSRLSYVLLLGDANSDYRNFLGRETQGDGSNCLVPALSDRFRTENLGDDWPYFNEVYTTDDYIVSLDAEDDSVEVAIPDLAVGRLPATSLTMADQMVDRVIAYESTAPVGLWKNIAVLAADDNYDHCNSSDWIPHTSQADRLARDYLPPELDLEKIYLNEYECDYGGFKPEAQQRLFGLLDQGVLLFNYVGHGGNDVLADEILLLTRDLPSLSNSERRFLFVSASCNVGEYDDPSNNSMSEDMMTLPGGGAIGTMASSALSGAYFNSVLNRNFIAELFPERRLGSLTPIGSALLRSKVRTQIVNNPTQGVGAENERYAILGDPALTLKTPSLQVEFDSQSTDTLRIGGTVTLAGRILRDGLFAPDFEGDLQLSVRASADTSGYHDDQNNFDYHLPGPEIYRGRIRVTDGRFQSPALFVPGLPDSALGGYGRVRAFAIGEAEAVGVLDSLPVLTGQLPTDNTPPALTLSLLGDAQHATPGAEIVLRAAAQSGINFIGTHPRNSTFLEFVEAELVENLTDRFEYDLGSATAGEVRSILPSGLAEGPNSIVASVADNLGNVGRDTLSIWMFEEGRNDLVGIQVFPNPFTGYCNLSFDLTAPARVKLSIYTLSGRRIRHFEQTCVTAGRYAFEWYGRDDAGDDVANGTYLYRLAASYDEAGGVDQAETGALVRMRD